MRSCAIHCLGWVLMALLCASSRGVGATYYDSEYLIDSWQTEQGLPENSANALVQSPDGYLWVATFGGLVRFDGMKFKVFNSLNTPELPSDGIVNLYLDHSDRLWVSTLKGIVVRERGKWSVLRKSHGSPSNYVRTFSEAAGVLCLTTFDGRVFRAQDGRTIELPSPPGEAGHGYYGHVDRKGTIWVGQDHFFGQWDGQRWVASPLAPLFTNNLRGLGTGRDGSLVAVSRNVLLRMNDGQVTAKSVLERDPNNLWRICEDSHANVWLCTQEQGVYRVAPSGVMRHFSTTNGLTQLGIRFVFEDREKNLWLGGSGGGFMRMRPRTFAQPDMSVLAPALRMSVVVEQSPGKILLGSYGGGLARMEHGRIDRVQPVRGGPMPRLVQSVLTDRIGNLWIGTYEKGVCVMDKNLELRALATADTGGNDAAALFEDSRGRIWIGGNETISLFANGQFRSFTNLAGLFLGGIKCFTEDPSNGGIWACSAEGLFRYEGGRWSEIKDAAGHSLDETICLRAESDGTLWIGGSTVPLRRLRGGILATISEARGLPVPTVASMLEDGLGYWWLGSSRGVVRIARSDLEQAANGGKGRLAGQAFNLSDGLPSLECVGGFQSTAMKDSQGRLWFATAKGVVTIDPRQLQINRLPPPVFIEQFRIEDSSGKQTSSSTSDFKPVVIPAGAREIKATFSALSYTAPEKIHFAYKIDGFRNDWEDIGNEPRLFFFPPGPGQYRFHVKAANNDGVWNEVGATLAFTVQPFVWQTLWFRLLACAGALGGTSLTVWRAGQSRANRKIERLERERALEQERARLASVVETTSDFVGFSTPDGRILFLNRAGRRLLGIGEAEVVHGINVAEHYPAWAEVLLRGTALPIAVREGTWTGELALKHRDGREIPVSQVIVAHRSPDGSLDFISTIARDISVPMRALDALRESEARLRNLTQAAFEAICISENGLIRDMNEQFLKMFGCERDETVGKPILDLVAPGSRALVEEAIRTDREGSHEHGLLRRDGTIFEAEARVKMIHVGDRSLRMTALRDVHERKQSELKHMRLAAIVEFSQEAIIGESLDGIITSWNRGAELIFGYSEAEVVGRPVLLLVPPGREPEQAEALALIARGEIVEHFESAGLRKDGSLVDISATVSPLKDGAGKVIGASKIARDVTERKRMETLAVGQRKILEMIAGDAPLPKTLDALLGIIEAQAEEMFCSILVLDPDGVHLRHVSAPRLPEAYTRAIDGEAIGPNAGSCGTAAYRRRPVFVADIASDPLWANYKAVALEHGLRACWSMPIFDGEQNVLGTFAVYHRRPVPPGAAELELVELASHTAAIAMGRQRAKAVLQETEAQLRQMQKMEGIGQLAGGVAHDFNNILSALLIQTELIGMVEHLPEEAREGLNHIQDFAQRAAGLTRQLLLFSRRQVMQARRLDLNELVMNLGKMLQRVIGEGVELQLNLHAAPLMVYADAGMLDQVLVNLAVNARDAMSGVGRVLIRTEETSWGEHARRLNPEAKPGRYAGFSVSDTGTGIPPAVMPRIFEPFFTTKAVGKGTGLGLATVFGIVKQHQGWITVDNHPGQGVTFQICLPMTVDNVEESAPSPAKLKSSGGTETILLVEDESAVRNLGRNILERHGYKVVAAADGMEALKLWGEHRGTVALLLTDLIMPGGLGGQELARRLQAEQPRLKVIFTSGYSADIAGREFHLGNGETFIQKPFGTEVLLETIRRSLDG